MLHFLYLIFQMNEVPTLFCALVAELCRLHQSVSFPLCFPVAFNQYEALEREQESRESPVASHYWPAVLIMARILSTWSSISLLSPLNKFPKHCSLLFPLKLGLITASSW